MDDPLPDAAPGAPSGAPSADPGRLPLRRPEQHRWAGGVCAGLALHLDLPVRWVRVVAALTVLAGGAGALVYVFWWVTVPTGDPRAAAAAARPAALGRVAPRLRSGESPVPVRDLVLGTLLLGVAALLLAVRAGLELRVGWVAPALIVLAGTALAWSQLDAAQRGRWLSRAGGRTSTALLRIVGGLVLVVVGVLLLATQAGSFGTMLRAAVAALAMLAGAAVVLAPWWLRLVRELGDERAARARESERADIAAHLHDSVLQTLALIRTRADDAEAVSRLARAQERELREWLYSDRPVAGTSLAAELRELVGEIEDARIPRPGGGLEPVAVDVVVVGDCVPTVQTTALLQAVRESLVNAVSHGAPPVSVYLEVRDERVEAFVRDRGDGFDMDTVPADRFGVRESVVGRVRRRGGSAELVSRPGWGTEVRLGVPRQGGAAPEGATTADGARGAGTEER
ncbi:ATP-binding protein [Cellulomonas sp. PhB143]|uniref:ATP-binding protein n=1 Tax=Cellulomonas sp. PhB143 TaxID=2485186 RepID=UPI000F47E914|nr:ATP-binding protein [Cellulomonas sp. PhB143]ROS79004.1 phage shock protein C (PspC) family protein [Cellulomonas sp. PhB143]